MMFIPKNPLGGQAARLVHDDPHFQAQPEHCTPSATPAGPSQFRIHHRTEYDSSNALVLMELQGSLLMSSQPIMFKKSSGAACHSAGSIGYSVASPSPKLSPVSNTRRFTTSAHCGAKEVFARLPWNRTKATSTWVRAIATCADSKLPSMGISATRVAWKRKYL